MHVFVVLGGHFTLQNGVLLLQTKVVQPIVVEPIVVKQNGDYALAQLGSNTCPTGFGKITNPTACATAGQALLEVERGIETPPSFSYAPSGCISHEDKRYYFNTNQANTADEEYAVICSK